VVMGNQSSCCTSGKAPAGRVLPNATEKQKSSLPKQKRVLAGWVKCESDEETAFSIQQQGVDFSKLIRRSPCDIPETAKRAITLVQLEMVLEHMRCRLQDEIWMVGRPTTEGFEDVKLTLFSEANLYDLNRHVIKPATWAGKCSMVEALATQAQPPDYFVSHWWGEPIVEFIACLRQHRSDRSLRTPAYWVCAYANNQHSLEAEIKEDLEMTSFFLALTAAKGTVSVIDRKGVCFSRIWVRRIHADRLKTHCTPALW